MNCNVILIRHGQSIYNLENKFTGWKDVELTDKGKQEALSCSNLIKKYKNDACYTSNLKRAQNTLSIITDNLNIKPPVEYDVCLNERDYGDLIGKNKKDTAIKYGEKQVEIWRRSFDTPPPNGESLKMTCERVIPYLENKIYSDIHANNYKNIIIAAHGNSIRAIIKHVLNYSPELILKTEIGWCEPWILTFNEGEIVNLEIIPRKNSKTMSSLPHLPNFKKTDSIS